MFFFVFRAGTVLVAWALRASVVRVHSMVIGVSGVVRVKGWVAASHRLYQRNSCIHVIFQLSPSMAVVFATIAVGPFRRLVISTATGATGAATRASTSLRWAMGSASAGWGGGRSSSGSSSRSAASALCGATCLG